MAGDLVGDDFEAFGASGFAFEVADNVDPLVFLEVAGGPCRFGVEESNAEAVGDTAIAVVFAVDRGVELVVAADGGEEELVGGEVVLRDGVDGEFGAGVGGVEFALVGVGEIEAAGLTHAGVVLCEPGDDVFDVLTDVVIIIYKIFAIGR